MRANYVRNSIPLGCLRGLMTVVVHSSRGRGLANDSLKAFLWDDKLCVSSGLFFLKKSYFDYLMEAVYKIELSHLQK